MKVYCNDCKHYKYFEMSGAYCTVTDYEEDTPACRRKVAFDSDKQNKNNDCEFYEPSIFERIRFFFRNEEKDGTS